ncbi:hypothetical protein FACS1894217_10270 [Clostridia bacterium]|nr:hypothetical protein FACS1894217_10270 [Clostridia bacterium]
MKPKHIILTAVVVLVLAALFAYAHNRTIVMSAHGFTAPSVIGTITYSNIGGLPKDLIEVVNQNGTTKLGAFRKNWLGIWSLHMQGDKMLMTMSDGMKTPGEVDSPSEYISYVGAETNAYYIIDDPTINFDSLTLDDFPPGYAIEYSKYRDGYIFHITTYKESDIIQYDDLLALAQKNT